MASSLTTANIEAVVQQVLSHTSTALFVTSGRQPWFFDTACCNHMTPNESQFSNKVSLKHPITIYTADGTPMPVSHKGIISSLCLSLSDTFHIPKLSLNLLSVGQLCELGVDLLFTNHGVDVQDPQTGQVLRTCRKVGRMFDVHDLKIPSQVVSAAATTATLSLDLWHARFGHPSLSRLQLLASQGHLGSLQFQKFDCTSCHFGKQKNCPLIIVTHFLLHLLILYILIFGVLHLFPLRRDLDILSYLWMIFFNILGFICFTIGLNLCLFTKHFIK